MGGTGRVISRAAPEVGDASGGAGGVQGVRWEERVLIRFIATGVRDAYSDGDRLFVCLLGGRAHQQQMSSCALGVGRRGTASSFWHNEAVARKERTGAGRQ